MIEPSGMKTHALSAWNRHDLDAIVEHYAENVFFQGDTVASRWEKPDGVLHGKAELREHFKRGLEMAPTLLFEFEELFTCPGGYAVRYRRERRGSSEEGYGQLHFFGA
jgi:hypothetical protein